jgi:hypothetical protein
MRSFGWNVVELETSLYERYLRISVERSLVTIEMFRAALAEMEARGYVSRELVHGERAFRRLLAEKDLPQKILPRAPLDEMHLVIGSLRAKLKEKSKGTPVIQWAPLTEDTS